jgi:hypothetical protein
MVDNATFRKQLDLADQMMKSICEMSDLRLKELGNPKVRGIALAKIEQSFQMIQDLCSVTSLLIKEIQKETEVNEGHRAAKAQ